MSSMEEGLALNIEDYRRSHESNAEWKLRRQFLVTHQGKFSENRLLCLANCFINVECYSCQYPEGVMRELKQLMEELGGDVLDDHRKQHSKRNAVQFVKGDGQ